MSVQKGMIINYMLPVSILIILTTIYSLNGIRKINLELSKLELTSSAESLNALKNELDVSDKLQDCTDEEITSLRECKKCLKILCVVQTSYDIVWFVAVLALENVNYSNSMSIVYSVTSCLLVSFHYSLIYKKYTNLFRTGTFLRGPNHFYRPSWVVRKLSRKLSFS